MRLAKAHLVIFGLICAVLGWWLSSGDRTETPFARADFTPAQDATFIGEVQPPLEHRIYDPNVRPANALLPVVTATAVLGADSPIKVTSVKQSGYIWEDLSGTIQLVDNSRTLTLSGTSKPTEDTTVRVFEIKDGKTIVIHPHEIQGTTAWTFDIELPAPNDRRSFALKIDAFKTADSTNKAAIGPSTTVNVSLPATDATLRLPKITGVSATAYAVLDKPDDKTIKIYNRFLRLGGEQVDRLTPLKFHVFVDKTFVGEASPRSPVVYTDGQSWNVDLELPNLRLDTEGSIRVIAKKPGTGPHSVATEEIKFVMASAVNPLPIPAKPTIKKKAGDASPTTNLNTREFHASVTTAAMTEGWIAFSLDGSSDLIAATRDSTKKIWTAQIKASTDGRHEVVAVAVIGDLADKKSAPAKLEIRTSKPTVADVQPVNLALSPDQRTITVRFNAENKLDEKALIGADAAKPRIKDHANFELKASGAGTPPTLSTVEYQSANNSLVLTYDGKFPPESYTFTVKRENIVDVFGNVMEEHFPTKLFMPTDDETATVGRGITGPTGPNVAFSEYTEPRKVINGFNPSDRVESRVSRLYYFRDAHRVAQIINRDAKSYNRAAVDMQQQQADRARTLADQATDKRRSKERKAVEQAKKTREAERELKEAEANATNASNQAVQAAGDQQRFSRAAAAEADPDKKAQLEQQSTSAQSALAQLERVAENERRRAKDATNKVQNLREDESRATEEWQGSIAVEDRARENQFRREVAAAQADPDTYAPGKPTSQDPVQQTSVSVIGEGLIQLRGPMKGINVIRTMINQIDAPVGQVRVSVHTVQINGEKGDRMEVVAGDIQRYIDHSRFLTLQSAEMFRKAIVQVAAQRALELGNAPGMTQAERDRSYLYSFFGADFIHELEAMDSEFLHTGNKLLSLHSMDATSLASAMFVMALANNPTRMEILQTFESMMQNQLPLAEQNYFEAGHTSDGKRKLFTKTCRPEDFQLLSHNARFQSIRGMFDAELVGEATMTPIQREFVRLAQIFKSRLIVEMELKQRVMERSVIEERLGDRMADLKAAKAKEDAAKLAVDVALKLQSEKVTQVQQTFQQLIGQLDATGETLTRAQGLLGSFDGISLQLAPAIRDALTKGNASGEVEIDDIKIPYQVNDGIVQIRQGTKRGKPVSELECRKKVKDTYESAVFLMGQIFEQTLKKFKYQKYLQDYLVAYDILKQEADGGMGLSYHLRTKDGEGDAFVLKRLVAAVKLRKRIDVLIKGNAESRAEMRRQVDIIAVELAKAQQTGNYTIVFQYWSKFRSFAKNSLWKPDPNDPSLLAIEEADASFRALLASSATVEQKQQEAQRSRQELDHKKFLDMLVDEMEDKYIELLEGTRAHTANIDAYIKRLMTSLDDDFNTQFYYPTFRKVREASQMWDVQMGQVETTTVLANNRAFAKVAPQATMEFDLPKRDILITEAMNGAKAMMNDFGALAQDPTFLAMSKMGSGMPTSSQTGGASGGQSTVRNVLPGLSTDTAESVMGQQGPGGATFGSAMEGLIPDPAIYKFETGTGWEIRPVIQPDGQALVFNFKYMYSSNVREPVRADEKHLGRVKRHYVNTDVQLSNFELREISRYTVALKASRTSRGVPLFEDIPLVGVLFRPQPSQESSLQQNVILGQSTIFPTLFDLMGLRWAPVVADLDPLRLSNDEFIVRNRRRTLMNRVFDESSMQVDKFLRIPESERRMDLYRSQETIPSMHPDGYEGPGANLRDSQLREGYDPSRAPESRFIPGESREGSQYLPGRVRGAAPSPMPTIAPIPLQPAHGNETSSHSSRRVRSGGQPAVSQLGYSPDTQAARFPNRPATFKSRQPVPTDARPDPRVRRLPSVDQPHSSLRR